MTASHPTGKLFVLMGEVSNPAPTYPSGLRDRFLEEEKSELKEINSSHTFQNEPRSNPGRLALDRPAVYEFKVAQSLSEQRAAWFDGLELTHDDQGNTLLTGTIMDQAALYGVLIKIRDLNLILLSIIRK